MDGACIRCGAPRNLYVNALLKDLCYDCYHRTPTMDINATARQINDNARDKGFYQDYESLLDMVKDDHRMVKFVHELWLGCHLMLVVSELGEALEGIRHSNYSEEPKSGGFREELADAVIRLLDIQHVIAKGDPANDIKLKMDYNMGRAFKHGGKAL